MTYLSPNRYRNTWAGEVSEHGSGETLRVAGWVHRRRDHGGLIFIDLRDRSGLLQLVFDPDLAAEAHAVAGKLRSEDVISVEGELVLRGAEHVNPELATGKVELRVKSLELISDSDTPPFPIDEDGPVDEALRLKHRALDLRRQQMNEALVLRHRIVATMREYLDSNGFIDIETPILTRSTPEGARDFLVPARLDPGTWFALPQSPQLFKQLLMVAGFERYYQVARCFRDEDLRADRQLEFTQLDIEMSFVEEDDVIVTIEGLLAKVFQLAGWSEEYMPPWPRIGYAEAISRYGTDRPDLRFGLEIEDLGEAVKNTDFKVFAAVLQSGGVIRGLNAGKHELARSELDALTQLAQKAGAKGLVWAFVQEDGTWRSPVAKFLSSDEIEALGTALGATPGDLLFAVADTAEVASHALGELRLELAERFNLVPEGAHAFTWVVDFPMFAWNADEQRFEALHHPFTSPAGPLDDPVRALSRAYDIVLDGQEIGGGSIRIHSPVVQQQVLELLGIDEAEAQERFGFLLDSLRYGAPPHGGLALGVDRIAALIAGRESIRDVIAFPKSASGADPLTGAPTPVSKRQLKELRLV